ncbi:MAG: hypothetical protein HZA20_03545 [Nitrospirae bacterium]|nr:hypothetical protein [Nitrospirota bacterium]
MRSFTIIRLEDDGAFRVENVSGKPAGIKSTQTGRYEEAPDGAYTLTLPPGTAASSHVYLDLPPGFLSMRVITTPFSDDKKIRELLPVEAEDRFMTPASDLVLDYISFPKDGGERRILLCAAQETRLAALVNALIAKGFDPQVIGSTAMTALMKQPEASIEQIQSPPPLSDTRRAAIVAEEMRKPSLNLRRGRLRSTSGEQAAAKMLRWSAALAALCMALVAANWFIRYRAAGASIESHKKSQAELFQKVFPKGSKMVDPTYQIKARTKELATKLGVLSGIDPLELLETVADAKSATAGVVVDEIRATGDSVTIRGTGPSFGVIDMLADRFKTVYSDVKIADSKASSESGVRFSLTFTTGKGGV